MLVNLRVGFAGFATLELVDKASRRVKRTWRVKNLITDAGLNAIGNGVPITDLISYAAAGTTNTAPAAGQTALISEVAPAVDNRTNDDADTDPEFGIEPTYTWARWVRVFGDTQAVGTLRELGLFSAAAGGTMWSRFLVTDEEGNPDFVEKENTDELRLTYELRLYPPVVDSETELSIKGTATTIEGRACNFEDNDAWGADGAFFSLFGLNFNRPHLAYEENTLVAIDADPDGAGVVASGTLVAPYANGTFYRDVRARWNVDVANFALGVGRVSWVLHGGTSLPMFHHIFTPRVDKTDEERLSVTARVSWSRHE